MVGCPAPELRNIDVGTKTVTTHGQGKYSLSIDIGDFAVTSVCCTDKSVDAQVRLW
jgi:hypothetical protein